MDGHLWIGDIYRFQIFNFRLSLNRHSKPALSCASLCSSCVAMSGKGTKRKPANEGINSRSQVIRAWFVGLSNEKCCLMASCHRRGNPCTRVSTSRYCEIVMILLRMVIHTADVVVCILLSTYELISLSLSRASNARTRTPRSPN